jgi:hypothetical protein
MQRVVLATVSINDLAKLMANVVIFYWIQCFLARCLADSSELGDVGNLPY